MLSNSSSAFQSQILKLESVGEITGVGTQAVLQAAVDIGKMTMDYGGTPVGSIGLATAAMAFTSGLVGGYTSTQDDIYKAVSGMMAEAASSQEADWISGAYAKYFSEKSFQDMGTEEINRSFLSRLEEIGAQGPMSYGSLMRGFGFSENVDLDHWAQTRAAIGFRREYSETFAIGALRDTRNRFMDSIMGQLTDPMRAVLSDPTKQADLLTAMAKSPTDALKDYRKIFGEGLSEHEYGLLVGLDVEEFYNQIRNIPGVTPEIAALILGNEDAGLAALREGGERARRKARTQQSGTRMMKTLEKVSEDTTLGEFLKGMVGTEEQTLDELLKGALESREGRDASDSGENAEQRQINMAIARLGNRTIPIKGMDGKELHMQEGLKRIMLQWREAAAEGDMDRIRKITDAARLSAGIIIDDVGEVSIMGGLAFRDQEGAENVNELFLDLLGPKDPGDLTLDIAEKFKKYDLSMQIADSKDPAGEIDALYRHARIASAITVLESKKGTDGVSLDSFIEQLKGIQGISEDKARVSAEKALVQKVLDETPHGYALAASLQKELGVEMGGTSIGGLLHSIAADASTFTDAMTAALDKFFTRNGQPQ